MKTTYNLNGYINVAFLVISEKNAAPEYPCPDDAWIPQAPFCNYIDSVSQFFIFVGWASTHFIVMR